MLALIAERVQVSDEIVGFAGLKHLSEGRHLLTAIVNLHTDLFVVETTADCRQVGTLYTAGAPDRMALRTTVTGEGLGSSNARIG
jgi:hypothetical protein